MGDLISREAALKTIEGLRHDAASNWSEGYMGACGEARRSSFDDAYKAVQGLSAADTAGAPETETPLSGVGEVEGLVEAFAQSCFWLSTTAYRGDEDLAAAYREHDAARTALLAAIRPRGEEQGASSGPDCRPSDQAPSGLAGSAASIPRAEDAWISVEDKLPGEQGWDSEEVLLFLNGHCRLTDFECRKGGGHGIRLGFYDAEKGCFRVHGRPEYFVTHWMTLPPAPAIEARSAETQSGSVEDESAVDVVEAPVSKANPPTAPTHPRGEGLTLTALHAANIARQAEWCPDQVPDLSFRGNELGGECGEAQNVIKKLERERHGWRGSRATKDQLAQELADVVICASLCAVTAGIDLERATVEKFNATSEANGLSTKLPAPRPSQGETGDA